MGCSPSTTAATSVSTRAASSVTRSRGRRHTARGAERRAVLDAAHDELDVAEDVYKRAAAVEPVVSTNRAHRENGANRDDEGMKANEDGGCGGRERKTDVAEPGGGRQAYCELVDVNDDGGGGGDEGSGERGSARAEGLPRRCHYLTPGVCKRGREVGALKRFEWGLGGNGRRRRDSLGRARRVYSEYAGGASSVFGDASMNRTEISTKPIHPPAPHPLTKTDSKSHHTIRCECAHSPNGLRLTFRAMYLKFSNATFRLGSETGMGEEEEVWCEVEWVVGIGM
ncbi:hypothetical protein DFP72DRAFT_1050875 [Ephemerocybe angulata]|uniref:Uncharacterized protein n=1 Tax=Ephemerocybe angulata TaxID=980116 RepID=A0A8H6LXB8_9AGAR|nr:hypothetical protein DFP72DRAFT_1050875 [Tulosesus angulatus]